ncbi:carboxyl transferase domain-containing protein [Dermacoccaceae bacterium W4C1]
MFSRIAVVNRGESAMRLIHAVRDLNAEASTGAQQVSVIALHTTEERHAMFVREADYAYDLGPAADRPYLDHAVLEQALVASGADAAWVGWGFVAEDPEFARLCARIGVRFIGPDAEAMSRLGDKIEAKQLAEQVGVPVAPWSGGGVATLAEATEQAGRIGYPLMLKATAGGGGRGIRMVASDAELAQAFTRTSAEAERAFGSGVVFLERLVTGARHVEVQVIADGQGTAWAIGVRDCSVQRRNQKIIEESASPVLSAQQEQLLRDSAERLALAVGYSGAGTVEFLYQPAEDLFAFLEVNTRLQVEHPITEETTGTDLVRWQLRIAAGERLEGPRPQQRGHAVEARLNAEDPDRDFAPSPGRIDLLELPTGPGIRVDTGVATGDEIPSAFDSMIAKIIAVGSDRAQALGRLRRALRETTVVIDGGATNKSFVLDLLDAPEVIDGSADTGWIDRQRELGRFGCGSGAAVALVVTGIEAYESEESLEQRRLLETARGGRPQVQHQPGRRVQMSVAGATAAVTVRRTGPQRFRVCVESGSEAVTVSATMQVADTYRRRLRIEDRSYRVVTATRGPVHTVEVDGVAHRVSLDSGGVLRSPAPALVVATPAAVGDQVEAGAPVLVLESMKMETVLLAPYPAVVRELEVSTGSQVETGAVLVRLEPVSTEDSEGTAAAAAAPELDLDLPQPQALSDRAALDSLREQLRSQLLGFDVDPQTQAQEIGDYLQRREPQADAGMIAGEVSLITTFADLAELGRNRPVGEEMRVETRTHSPREHLHSYLQALDVERSGIPESFQERLGRVLRHYGVDSLERSPELERAVLRIFLAQQQLNARTGIITGLLRAWLSGPRPSGSDAAREGLDRLVQATQVRFPVLASLARSVRFRWFDQPQVDQDRQAVLSDVAADLDAVEKLPAGAARDAQTDRLATIPEPLVEFLAQRLRRPEHPPFEPMLSVLVKRHYRANGLSGFTEQTRDGRAVVTGTYRPDQSPRSLVSTVGRLSELKPDSALAALLRELIGAGTARSSIVDLYLDAPEAAQDPAQVSQDLRERLQGMDLPPVRRLAVAVVPPSGRSVEYFTFRPGPEGGLVEDDLIRGVHPMVARRLALWRLRDFDITRLDAPQDVLLYHCVAPDNPSDQRLVALSQVRQLAVIRDEDGRVTGLPHAERALANCVEGIRRARAGAGGRTPLDQNHIWIHIWPHIEAGLPELTALKESIAPATSGAGMQEVVFSGSVVGQDQQPEQIEARFHYRTGAGVVAEIDHPATEHLQPLDDYAEKVLRARRRGVVYPYQVFDLITGAGGTVTEYDLDTEQRLVPVHRPYGLNTAGITVGVVSTPTERYPEGVTRVVLAGDPLRALGALGEDECARVIAALELAESMSVPLEWFAVSAGARISMESGTENMDWVAKALKKIVEFTQGGGEINIVVSGINVGAQPYWNAEATMLMHTRGILVMTPESAMVLTGKQSLDFSGGVSAEDNHGIGGYDRVMGPNGQAQYWVPDLAGAVATLMGHYEHTYVAAGEQRPRAARTRDPIDRDVTTYPHTDAGSEFTTVGDIFSARTNPDRKKPFDIRTVMAAVADSDHERSERWADMAEAENSVVQDAHIGGIPVCLIGIESKSTRRRGFPPADGPDTYTAGTLFPRSSKKTARALNSSSGNRPVVVLANLSGFDGSPESMRNLQLEYGAEIGRAIVNFSGPIVFVVVSRYHGGAFVVFSKALNPQMTVLAVEGSRASVIGGAPAAAVVFTREVDRRTATDPRVLGLERELSEADGLDRAELSARTAGVRAEVRSEKLGEVAAEFDSVHDIHRAVRVGSVDEVISADQLRPRIVRALREGLGQGLTEA